MKRVIDPQSWARREYFEHYNGMDNPYFSLTAETDVTRIYDRTKAENDWFYVRYLHAILRAVNDIGELRYRIERGRVVQFDRIHISPTVGRDDGSFGFSHVDYDPDYMAFRAAFRAETERVRAGSGLMKREGAERIDTIYSTALPWVRFTDLTHPMNLGGGSGVMLLATGQVFRRDGKRLMPLQFSLHHGFADGRHAGLFLERVQRYFDE